MIRIVRSMIFPFQCVQSSDYVDVSLATHDNSQRHNSVINNK